MSDDVSKDAGMRGLALQCPWSNCFPQLYDYVPRPPCSNTPFADFREVIDHIWKYHSSLLSCDKCGHRFKGARRGEKGRVDLDRLKNEHDNRCHSVKAQSKDVPINPRDSIKTMTEEQDKILKNWRAKKGNDGNTVESNYRSLCSSLFGNDVEVPTNLRYNYLIAEHTINPESARLGERNEAYVTQYRVAAHSGLTAGSHQQLSPNPYQYTKDPLQLDEGPRPSGWAIPKPAPDQDSGYASGPSGETALQANNGAYINSTWDYDSSWRQSNENVEYAYGGTTHYFVDALNYPPSVDIETGDSRWELENPDGPVD
ncbi:hypothetical protein F5B21DRAFT_413286 [Xylaria acuta]|nr:hypothetical protein F5B21DRAFT_413286 [Xylaria acuta]